MNWIHRKRGDIKTSYRSNKVLSVIKKKKQTNPKVMYIINSHSRSRMRSKHITQRDVVKSIEEFDKMYENRNWTVVEKRLWEFILRTVFSMNSDKKVNIITTMHINENKFQKSHIDEF